MGIKGTESVTCCLWLAGYSRAWVSVSDVSPGAVVWVTHSPSSWCQGLEAPQERIGKPQWRPPLPPSLCVFSVLVAGGNWAQAQGELTVCTNTDGGGQEKEETRKAGPRAEDCLSFLEMQTWVPAGAKSASGPSSSEAKDPDGPDRTECLIPANVSRFIFRGTPHYWLH